MFMRKQVCTRDRNMQQTMAIWAFLPVRLSQSHIKLKNTSSVRKSSRAAVLWRFQKMSTTLSCKKQTNKILSTIFVIYNNNKTFTVFLCTNKCLLSCLCKTKWLLSFSCPVIILVLFMNKNKYWKVYCAFHVQESYTVVFMYKTCCCQVIRWPTKMRPERKRECSIPCSWPHGSLGGKHRSSHDSSPHSGQCHRDCTGWTQCCTDQMHLDRLDLQTWLCVQWKA